MSLTPDLALELVTVERHKVLNRVLRHLPPVDYNFGSDNCG